LSTAAIGSQRVFPAVQYLGCEALTMILVQCTTTDDLASCSTLHYTIGQLFCVTVR